MFKKLLIIAVTLSLATPALADTVNPAENDFSYLFHLYYDTGKLVADRDFQFNYDIIAAPYVAPANTPAFPYRGEIINFGGEVAAHFVFDPKGGDAKFVKGKLSVKAPYVADGQKAIFYDNQNSPILTVPVSGSSFCNDDGICNSSKGEDSLSCPKDCKAASLPAPPVNTSNGSSGTDTSGIWAGILYIVIGLGLIGGFWWVAKRRARGPAGYPPSGLPTPPPPPSQNNQV